MMWFRLSFIQEVWVQAPVTGHIHRFEVSLSKRVNLYQPCLLLTLYLDHSAGGRQANRLTSCIARQYSLILLNRCENCKKNSVISFVAFKEKKNLTRNYALCSSCNARGGSAQITAFHFPRLWTACLQI